MSEKQIHKVRQDALDSAQAKAPYNSEWRMGHFNGFITGRTVSAVQVAAIADPIWDQLVGVAKTSMREAVADCLRAAGFLIEGDGSPFQSEREEGP